MIGTTREDVRDAIVDALSWRETLHPADENGHAVPFCTTTRSDLHTEFTLLAGGVTFRVVVEKL